MISSCLKNGAGGGPHLPQIPRPSRAAPWFALPSALLLLICSSANGGFNNGIDGMGAPFTAAESAAVVAAIGQIRLMASSEPHIGTSATLIDIADCLEASLKKGKLCRETNPKADWKGITAPDNKCSWEGDAINIAADCLSSTEPAFSQLIAVLVHEGIHAIQWNDGSSYTDSAGAREWVAYQWEKYILERRINEQTLTREELAAIKERLRVVCSWADHYCHREVIEWREYGGGTNGFYFVTNRVNRADDARRARNVKSLNNPSLRYQSTYPISGNIEIFDTATQTVLRSLNTGFEVPTAMTVFRGTNGRDFLYVAGSDASLSSGGIRTFTDQDGDGLLDQASGTTLLTTPFLPLALDQDTNSHQLYMAYFDQASHVIIMILDDTNADGLPDTQRPAPFATGMTFPGLDDMYQIQVAGPGILGVSPRPFGMDEVDAFVNYGLLVDNNNDGVADQFFLGSFNSAWSQHPSFPVLMNDVQNGDRQAMVWATPGSQIQILLTDSSGNPLGILGSGPANSANFVNTINFVDAAPPGLFFKIIDQTHGLDNRFLYPISPNRPEIFTINRTAVLPGTLVLLNGRNFAPNATVRCSGTSAIINGTPTPTSLSFFAPEVGQIPGGEVAVQVSTPQGTSKFVGLYIHGDCNGNGIPDIVDIGSGTSQDVNADGVPDECERLHIVLSGGIAVVTWMNPTAVLQRATNVTGPWTSMPGVSSPFSYPLQSSSQQFFRLQE